MSELEVRIVQLGPLHVASALGFGEGPEGQAAEKILAFARRLGCLEQQSKPRFFGFNHPSPSAGSPNYGYEMWMEVEPEVQGEGEVTIKDFPGGLYAVTRCLGVEPIPGAWKALSLWLEKSPYQFSNHQWLEQHVAWVDLPLEQYVLDLYAPIKK